MKKIFQLTALLMLCFFGACSEDALDGLSGKYDMERRVYKKIIEKSKDKSILSLPTKPVTNGTCA